MSVELFLSDPDVQVWHGDALETLQGFPDWTFSGVVTSPPYGDARPEYGSPTPLSFFQTFRELRRVCTGGMALNVGRRFRDGRESRWYEELVLAAELAGWPHIDTLIWAKPNANPIVGPVLTNAHEYVFLFGQPSHFDADAVRLEYARGTAERMRRRFVSSVSVKGDTSERNGARRDAKRCMNLETNPAGARAPSVFVASVGRHKGNEHPAPMALELADMLVRLVAGHHIIDPYAGSGTTALAARAQSKRSTLIELDAGYCQMSADRLAQQVLLTS